MTRKTWVKVPTSQVAVGVFRALVPVPGGDGRTGFVSLRTVARDAAGNAVSQQVVRAYQVK